MPAKTEKQRKFFGMIHGANKQGKKLKGKASKVQKKVSDKTIKHFTMKEQFKTDNDLIIEAFNEQKLNDGIAEVTKDDASKLFKSLNSIKNIPSDLQIFVSMFKDYYSGKYTKIPWNTIAALILGLTYLLLPVDVIPDVIPFIGQIDDAVILKWLYSHVAKQDLENYKNWKNSQPHNS